MEALLLIARLVLALVFAAAGVSKALDMPGSRRALIGFGLPKPVAVPTAAALVVIELLLALALIPTSTAWWGAVGGLALLLIFTAGIAVNLARGQASDCHCFGQFSTAPIGWTTLARNLGLTAVAGLIVTQGKDHAGLSALSWLTELRTAEAVGLFLGGLLTALLAVAIVLLRRVVRQQKRVLAQMETAAKAVAEEGGSTSVVRTDVALPQEGLPIGAPAPQFSLPALSGGTKSLDDLLGRGTPVMLLFVSASCWGCRVLLPMVQLWQRDYVNSLTIAVVSKGRFDQGSHPLLRYPMDNVLLDENSSVSVRYQVKWTPAVMLIESDGRIATQVTYGDNAIRELFRNLVASGQLSNGKGVDGQTPQVALRYSTVKIGEPGRKFSLSDLAGKVVTSEDLWGTPTLLLFWHPQCEFCRAMIEDLKKWEENRPKDSAKLVFIAAGKVEDIRPVNEGFRSLTLLDSTFELGKLFGTKYTPAAILIGSDGRVQSSLAMGDPNVRALIGISPAGSQADRSSGVA